MGVVEKADHLRDLLETKRVLFFEEDDINKLVSHGFISEASFAGVSKEDLQEVLPGRGGIVAALVAAFKEGEPSPKKRKMSPAGPILGLETKIAEESKYLKDLLAPPEELPIEVADLRNFFSQTSRPLPFSSPSFFSVRDPELVKFSSPAESSVARYVDVSWDAFQEQADNEADSSHKLRVYTGGFLFYLNSLALRNQKLVSLRTTFGTESTATTLVPLKTPDFAAYILNALILRWENEIDPAGFGTAWKENTEKLKVWSCLYYGNLPYVIGGCCGGSIFQWLRLSKKGVHIVADSISKPYDLSSLTGVVEVLHSVVQMHRLLQKLQERLTDPVPIILYKEIRSTNGTVLVSPEFVLKTLENLGQEEVVFLQSLYEKIAGSKYLIQLKGGIMCTRNFTKLKLYPVGHPSAKPDNLEELRNATHDMLYGLVDLHTAGFTHRDLRWENCIRDFVQGKPKWVLIDLECAGRDGDTWDRERLLTWDDLTLTLEGQYTTSSDMYQLGMLIVSWLDESREVSDDEKFIRGWGEEMKKRGEAAMMLQGFCTNPCTRCSLFNA